jgi:hypothetical protein
MCISFEISVISYIFGLTLFFIVFERGMYNDKWIAIFMFYILQMQLLEAVMWKDQSCKGYNQKASMIAYFFTILQPMANYLTMMYTVGYNDKTKYVTLLMIPYFISSIWYAINNLPSEDELCTKPETECWLEWKWMKKTAYWWIWLISLLIPFLALPDQSFNGLFPAIYILVSLVISFNFFTDMKYISKPSLWCLLQALLPMFILALG